MRILVATDAWIPQVDDVARTLGALSEGLQSLGVDVTFLTPRDMPTLAGIALPSPRRIAARIAAIEPDAIHIATAGPIGLATRWYCGSRGRPFTTSVHGVADRGAARRPVTARLVSGIASGLASGLGWSWLRWFHNAGRGTMAATASLAEDLAAHGIRSVLRWPRGVDARLFRPRPDANLGLLRPVFLAAGRLVANDNVAAFLALDLPGTKVVVGEGPARDALARRFPKAIFLGAMQGEDLARIYAAADVLVAPGRAEGSGLALLEALACGTPIAGLPVPATRDVIGDAPVAALDVDLRAACLRALGLPRSACRTFAETRSWDESARCFLDNIERAGVVVTAADALRAFKPAPEPARAERKRVEPAIL
jgi:glycosyltransferase involved in cell wall biosynthesis